MKPFSRSVENFKLKQLEQDSDNSSSSELSWPQVSHSSNPGVGLAPAPVSRLGRTPCAPVLSSASRGCIQACLQLSQLLHSLSAAAEPKAGLGCSSSSSLQSTLQDCASLLHDLVESQQQLQPRKRKRASSNLDAQQRHLAAQQAWRYSHPGSHASSGGKPHGSDNWQQQHRHHMPFASLQGTMAEDVAAQLQEGSGLSWQEDSSEAVLSSSPPRSWIRRCWREIAASQGSICQRLKFAEAVREATRNSTLLLQGLELGLAEPGSHAFSKRHMLRLTQDLLRDVQGLLAEAAQAAAAAARDDRQMEA